MFDNRDYPPLVLPPHNPEWETITDRFEAFHIANPHVYDVLWLMALELKASGMQRWGMKGLFEVLRWKSALRTVGGAYKLNNNFTALYARMLMEREPRLVGFFEVRERIEGRRGPRD
jgi:hypothetical protein